MYVEQYIENERLTTTGSIIYKTIWDKVFKNGPSEIFGMQPLKNLK